METLEIAAPKQVSRKFTSADFRKLPEGPPYFELINGTNADHVTVSPDYSAIAL